MKDTLYLPLKKKWYEMIESGVKTEEYREIKPYWAKRLCAFRHLDPEQSNAECEAKDCGDCIDWMMNSNGDNMDGFCRPYELVKFSYGYTIRTMTFEVKSIHIGYGKPEWGAPSDKEVFIIELGRRIK